MPENKLQNSAMRALESAPENALLPSSKQNILEWLNGGFLPDWALQTLLELFENKDYDELNFRFFKFLDFGTGGMRGRVIPRKPAKAELGEPSAQGTPQHAALGTNHMNDFAVIRATMGLFEYCSKLAAQKNLGAPKLVVAHDTRHFSRHFCELTASVWSALGGDALIFDGPRSVPQLSYTIIKEKALAGVAITASHNPPCDNGYKVYFGDGAQIIGQAAEDFIRLINSIPWGSVSKFSNIDISRVNTVGAEAEEAYLESLDDCVIDKNIMRDNKPRLVFSSCHGTGAVMCPKIMRRHGIEPILVEKQMVFDPRFPTIEQPNPEYAETFTMGVALANETGADCVMLTDPDSDRLGVACRGKDGQLRLLSGNMTGSLLMDYRLSRMIEKGLITNPQKCAVLKTFVTTPLQDAIAESYGVRCVNTLTGFKWIGAKLRKYQLALEAKHPDLDYLSLNYKDRAKLMQEDSTFAVFGSEESYGYIGVDSVRDKDANAALIMFCEMFAYLKSQNKSVEQYLDEIYMRHGYFNEELKSVYMEGPQGTQHIKNFLDRIEKTPLASVCGVAVAKVMNFNCDKIIDADGDTVPREKFFVYKLANGYSFAIRASGTEPKIKFYGFARETSKDPLSLSQAKETARLKLSGILDSLEDSLKSQS